MGCSFERQKTTAVTNSFQKALDDSNRKPNKTCVDKSGKFYKR